MTRSAGTHGKASEGKAHAGKRRNGAGTHGTLMVIGGHEDKDGDRAILREVATSVGRGALVIATVASEQPEELWKTYDPLFRELGVRSVRHLDVASREAAADEGALAVFDGATGVFFTGGDQLRITSLLGGTPVCERIRAVHDEGGVVAGTSAGASAMSATMLVGGAGEETFRIGASLEMAAGLGLVRDIIIDQHFAERGRIGRLLAAVAQNPRALGIGIDENTAICVEGAPEAVRFRVLGEGAVYVVDGREISYTNIAESAADCTLALFDVRLHVIADGGGYDVVSGRPTQAAAPASSARATAHD